MSDIRSFNDCLSVYLHILLISHILVAIVRRIQWCNCIRFNAWVYILLFKV